MAGKPMTEIDHVSLLAGNDLGPATELSAKMLKDGEKLQYICRNNGPSTSVLCRFQGSDCKPYGECAFAD